MTVHYPEQIAQVLEQPVDLEAMHHSVRATKAFQRACQLSGLSGAELCRQIAPLIGKPKPISRQTLADWRHGRRPVPLVAFLAACELAGLRPPMIFALASADQNPSPAGLAGAASRTRVKRGSLEGGRL